MPRSRDGSGGSAAGSQTPKSPPARSSVVHRRRNKVKSYHFRGHTPGWLLLAFGQFTFCASEMILLTKFLPTIIGTPENHFMVFWERRSSGGNEHSGLPGCERSAACNDDIEVKISCSPIRKSGFCHFFDGLSIFYLQFKNSKEKCVMIPDARRRRWE